MEALVYSGVDAMVLVMLTALGLDWLGQQARELDLFYVATNFTCEGIAMPSHRLVEVGDLVSGCSGSSDESRREHAPSRRSSRPSTHRSRRWVR